MILEKGRICLKVAGREAGKYCVVVAPIDESFVMITGPKSVTRVKRRKCNIVQLEPISEKFDLKSGEDSEIESAWKSSGLIKKLEIELPKQKTKPAKQANPVKKK
ncbi:MAG: 50S ribosomal protein L14e [Nanoarchaeota archaeon]|nr:50S ribosomal protein L14e [Nanoarchaeota archaeon]MBU4123909.1 50S ribosomal protein L14e [Nanoarchaeota archaeon]